jgi:hypothetical protein
MIQYIFVKTSDVNQAMVNKSVSKTLATLPTYTTSRDWWLFTTSQQFRVIEFDTTTLAGYTGFDNYEWFDQEAARNKLADFDENGD